MKLFMLSTCSIAVNLWQGKMVGNFFFFFFFLGLYLRHREVHWIGVKSELQLLAYDTASAMQDLSCVCRDLDQNS